MNIKPIILAGGEGTRLWPFSSSQQPKQFLQVFDKKSLFQLAVTRHQHEIFAETLVITNEEYRFMVAEQLREINVIATIITEPVRKNTLACIMAATLEFMNFDGHLIIIPADHLINNIDQYIIDVTSATKVIGNNIGTFGIKPDSAHTGYGYLEQGDQLTTNSFKVKNFIEKPDIHTAQNYMNQGNHLWNSGIYLFKPQVLIVEAIKYTTIELAMVKLALDNSIRTSDFIKLDLKYYQQLATKSIDYAIMEKTTEIVTNRVFFDWTDVGSWPALMQVLTRDENNNYIDGNILIEQVNNCYINSKKLTAVLGIQDLVIINTDEIMVISHKSHLGKINNVVDRLKQQLS